MNHVIRLLCFACLGAAGHAQFYAPPVDFHDVAQRRFPVEAARVLAWLRQSPEIAEIAYKVEKDTPAEIVWSIEWRKPGGGVLRRASVRYPEKALLGGAEWYRDVWRQLTGADWALARAETGDLAAHYWEGADSAGVARLEGVSAALARAAEPGAGEAARRAGALVQAALPMLTTEVSLDGALLARGAAWLCAAEQQAGAPLSVEWAPLLCLAHREREAKSAWAAGPKLPAAAAPLGRCWELIIQLPPAAAALREMARPENRLYAAPVFQAYKSTDVSLEPMFLDVAKKLYPNDRLERLADYCVLLNPLGRPLAPTLPMTGLRNWITLARGLAPARGDVEGLAERARAVHDFDNKKGLPSPSGELAALLNAGRHEAEGPLIPVAVVTGRELLVYAWEWGGVAFAGAQSESRSIRFFGPNPGDVEKAWTGAISGWSGFTERNRFPGFEPIQETGPLEHMSYRFASALLRDHPPTAWPAAPDAYLRRRWLMDVNRAVQFFDEKEGGAEAGSELVRRVLREAGPRTAGSLFLRANQVFTAAIDKVNWPNLAEVHHEIRRAVPMNAMGAYYDLNRSLAREPDLFKRAQALERFHWETGLAYAPQGVFTLYLRANATASAKRIYDRWAAAMKPQGFAFDSTLGAANYTLAVLEGDEPRAAATLREIRGTAERVVEITAAVLKDDLAEARRQADGFLKENTPAGVTHYEDYRKMRAFLDLVPALYDPRHRDHAQALDAFPNMATFVILQWALLKKAKLPPEEALRFLDGGENDQEQLILRAALQGDKALFARLYEEWLEPWTEPRLERSAFDLDWKHTGPPGVLFAYLNTLLFTIPPPKEEPDLAPPGAEPLLLALRKIAAEPLPVEPKKK